MNYTLAEWQQMLKPVDDCIVQASTVDGKDGWTSWPIGLGHHWLKFKHDPAYQLGPHDQLVYTAINPTSDKGRRGKDLINRQIVLRALSSKGIYNNFTTPQEYFRTLPKYKFVISPEGNGIDCHRHAEALLAGCIPVVEDRPEMREKYKGLPILWTGTYFEISKSYLKNQYEKMLHQTYDFSRLFLSSYTEQEQQQILLCSDYWLKKLC